MATLLHLTRDSVAASDDIDAPNERLERLEPDPESPARVQALLEELAKDYLANIAGPASWIAYSRVPLLVLSNSWSKAGAVWLMDIEFPLLDCREDGLHVRFVYLPVTDPDAALEVVQRSMSALRR